MDRTVEIPPKIYPTRDRIPVPVSKDGNQLKVGFVITATASREQEPLRMLAMARSIQERGDHVDLFLLGDGVQLIRGSGTGSLDALGELAEMGSRVFLSGEHLKASGADVESLPHWAETVERPYDILVKLSMEEWDRVVSL